MTISEKRLNRRPSSGRIAGVCAGIAEYLEIDVTLVRLAWIILSIIPGGIIGGVIAYAIAWIVVPSAPGMEHGTATAPRLRRSITDVRVAGVCAGIAEYFHLDPTVVRLLWAVLTVMPGAIVLGVLAYLVAWLLMPPATAPPPPLQTVPSSV